MKNIAKTTTHYQLLVPSGLVLFVLFGLYLYFITGEVKLWQTIKWMDVIAEGGTALLGLFWLLLLLRSRPAGRITLLLSIGICCFIFSSWMDFLDEFIVIPNSVFWDNWIESAPVPLGLILLTLGIYHWHKEEIAISAQMVKRERVFRDHRLFDSLIPLGGAEYLREQVKIASNDAKSKNQMFALLAIDIDNFSHINHTFGHEEGDRVLQSITQLLLLNLRDQDLLCRLAGDRFIAILPNSSVAHAQTFAEELQSAVASLAYKSTPVYGSHYGNPNDCKSESQRILLSATVAFTIGLNGDAETLIKAVNVNIDSIKQQRNIISLKQRQHA